MDLFDQQQRVDAFKSVWGVMEYVTRDVGKGETAAAPESAGGSMKT